MLVLSFDVGVGAALPVKRPAEGEQLLLCILNATVGQTSLRVSEGGSVLNTLMCLDLMVLHRKHANDLECVFVMLHRSNTRWST